MWDLKLIFLNFFFYLDLSIEYFFFNLLNTLNPLLFNGLCLTNLKWFYQFIFNSSFFFGLKFLLAIGFLILIRGGTPRYRYDYLTKLGWLRFIGLVLLVFFSSFIIFYVF